MLLAVDIGNTNIVFGLHQEGQWVKQWRVETSLNKDIKMYAAELSHYFLEESIPVSALERAILSSVVPPLTSPFVQLLGSFVAQPPILLDAQLYEQLQINVLRPHEIGSDLVANAVAAFERFRQACIVIDFGTALTFTSVDAQGQILGVAITPGLRTAVNALFKNTAQLPEVPLELPESAIGKNTVQALQAGVLWGYIGLVEFMIKRIREEIAVPCKVIATGGLSKVIEPLRVQFDEIDQLLTLDGLRIVEEYIRENRTWPNKN